MTKADLHLHSNCSDGSDSIAELWRNIKSSDIKIFALTDHDTVDGCEEMKKLVTEDYRFIPAIELTCKSNEIKCHLLGYNCDYTNQNLLNLVEKGKKLRKEKLETRIKYLKEVWDIELTAEERDWLYSRKSVVKTHLANILVDRNLADDNVSAMKKYLDGCKTGNTRFSIEESIDAIKSSGGIPVWAHPLGGEGEKHLDEIEFLKQLRRMIAFGIEGIECYYSRYTPAETEFLLNQAKENNLLISGGSDYHGSNKKNITIGKLNTENKDILSDKLTILNRI